ncbi:MAG: heme exporter protein CcmD [Moraxellaceae bacterium]|nr:heme exporter protein CcmD [Moraxellaceae bacterium]
MAFESFAEFLVMNWNGRPHGPYVWAAYGLTLAVVVWNIVQPVVRRRRWQREQLAQLKREARDGRQP